MKWSRLALALVSAAMLLTVRWAGVGAAEPPATVATSGPLRAWSGPFAAPTDRFGIGVHPGFGRPDQYDLRDLHMAWWSNWQTSEAPPSPGMDYVQLIQVRASAWPPDWEAIRRRARLNPGALWIIGNEPEGPYNQGNRTPAEYAQIYHEAHTRITRYDPTALVAIGGVIQPTPLRLKWLDLVLAEYRSRYGTSMPIDVWNIHVQILRERRYDWGAGIPAGLSENEGQVIDLAQNADPALFKQLVIAFRLWMNERGFRDSPLIISEYGVLMPNEYLADDPEAGAQRVCDFMQESFRWLLDEAIDPTIGYPADGNRLVQRWLWYSLNDQPYNLSTGEGFNGALFDHRNRSQLTRFGQCYRDFVATRHSPQTVDFAPRRLVTAPSEVMPGSATTVRLTATLTNRGEQAAPATTLRFFRGHPASGGTLLAERSIAAGLARYGAAATAEATATLTLPRGATVDLCVQVDGAGSVAESDETNNVLCSPVLAPYRLHLPIVRR